MLRVLVEFIRMVPPDVNGICWVVSEVVNLNSVKVHISTEVHIVVPSNRVTSSLFPLIVRR